LTARQTYQTSVANAEATARTTIAAAATTCQEAINAAGDNQGLNPQLGAGAAIIAKIATAQANFAASANAANATCNATKAAARETLRASGDTDIA